MRVFVTGARGFIGRELVRELRSRGHQVSGSSSRPDPPPPLHRIDLGEPFDSSCFEGVEVLVHCGYVVEVGSFERNVNGTLAIIRAAEERRVPFQLFVTSFSAHEAAHSEYGRSKYVLEQEALRRGHAVARPGLVIGNGGLFARIRRSVERSPVVPVPTGVTPVVGIDDLTLAIRLIVEQRLTGSHELYLDEGIALSRLVREIARSSGRRAVALPIPSTAAHRFARMLRAVSKRFAGIEQNLRGFRDNQQVLIRSDLSRFVPEPTSLSEMVDRALQQEDRTEVTS